MRLRARSVVLACVAALLSAPVGADNCPAGEVEYALRGRLRVWDTAMGRGDGYYDIGPGRTVLRFEGTTVKMLSFTMREYFTVRVKTVVWKTDVTTNAHSSATPDACGVVAVGTLVGNTVHWQTPVRDYRTDGALTCAGSFCGDFGAPPPGESQFHIPPAPTRFGDFVFANDWKTFTMGETSAAKTEMPKQTSAVSTAGREVRRTCLSPKQCAP